MLNGMIDVWGSALAGVDPMEIKSALDRLPTDFPEWPPTVGQFLALCNVGKYDLPEFKQLPRPWGSEEIAGSAFAELKSILRYK